MELLDHMVIVCLAFQRTAKLFSTAAAPFYILIRNAREFQFLHILTNAEFLKNYSHASGGERIS